MRVTTRLEPAIGALITGVCLFMTSPSTAAPSDESVTNECLDAIEAGQLARKAAKYRDARARFTTCARSSCPSAVVRDCARWLDELDQIQPTVIFSARHSAGHETAAIQIGVDRQPLAH